MANSFNKLIELFAKFKVDTIPDDRDELPITSKSDELATQLETSDSRISTISQLNEFRTIAQDRETQYNTYDEMTTDSVIAAALEIYADDATAYDEQGRVIWVESETDEIARAGNRLLDILEIPERAWKHIYQACKYGDYYLKLYRRDEEHKDDEDKLSTLSGSSVKIINDKVIEDGVSVTYPYDKYVEDVPDPATVYDLRKRGKTAGFIEVTKDLQSNSVYTSANVNNLYSLRDINVYKPDRLVHIMISENMTRTPETITLDIDPDTSVTYEVARGKSILYDVYPIQRELQLLEDSLLLNRLTRSSLIRLLEIEVGDMPKKEINNYLRRMKNLIEQHISFDKNTGNYKSYNSPGPIDNVIYIPVKNGQGHIDINNLGGDVNVRDIADIDYFNNKRSGALKIPRSFLGDNSEGCLRGSTSVLLLNGQRRSIEYLYQHQEEYVGKGIMSCNEDGSLLPTKIKAIKQTRKDATFIRVHLDNGKYFDVTPDHLCMTRDGEFIEAQNLYEGHSLMPMYDKVKSGRRYVWDNLEEVWYSQYRLVALTKYGELKKGYQVHHINQIKIDDDFDNLEQITLSEHYQKHSEMLHKESNKALANKREEDPEWWEKVCKKISNSSKGVPKSKRHRENISKALKGKPSNHPFEKGDKNPVHFMTEETHRKLSESHRAENLSAETRRKLSESHKGKKHTEETRKLMSKKASENHADMSGKNNPCYGKKLCNNGTIQKYIPKEDLNEFLLNNPDWEIGKIGKKAPHNHKVVKLEVLDVIEDAYDLQVESSNHTFILDAGVFVHNSQFDNGGTLTQLSIRYARTIKRIQTAYIRAITTLLNLFFIDMDLDYVNKFEVRMTSPSTQEDSVRVDTINSNVDMISSIMRLMETLEGDTQKEILEYLVNEVLKMPEIGVMINEDRTAPEDIDIQGDGGSFEGSDLGSDFGDFDDLGDDSVDISGSFEGDIESSEGEESPDVPEPFTDDEYSSFEDEL